MKLKNIRIAVATLALLAFGLAFLIKMDWAKQIAIWLTTTQFIPSLSEFIAGNHAAWGFLLIALATLLFGRVYCSFLCPLGIFQDVVIYVSGKLRRRRGKISAACVRHSKPWLQYPLLLLLAVSMVSGFALGVALLDPYSVFGRIAEQVFLPIFASLYNLGVTGLERCDIYAIAPIELPEWQALPFLCALALLALVMFMAATRGRGYCNDICPLGTFLGLLARCSVWRIRVADDCRQCNLCARSCKADCIDIEHKKVLHANCVACFNCLAACKFASLSYTPALPHKRQPQIPPATPPDGQRRRLLLHSLTGAVATVAGGWGLATRKQDELENLEFREPTPVLPPGAGDAEHYTSRCTSCYLCLAQCPTNVLRPAVLELGVAGMLQPVLDYRRGFCEYECNRCSQVCPTDAIRPLPLAQKKEVQIGVAKLYKKHCVVFKLKKDCSACSEHCPTQAILTKPYQDNLYAPHLNKQRCIGCGACEHVCPVNPKAIVVEGKLEHEPVPEKGPIEAAPEKKENDFPF